MLILLVYYIQVNENVQCATEFDMKSIFLGEERGKNEITLV